MVVWLLNNTILKKEQEQKFKGVTSDALSGVQVAGINAYTSTAAIPIYGPAMAQQQPATAIGFTTPMATAAIAAASGGLAGMAHSGMTEIPDTGTWLLDKGERVLAANQNQDLTNFLSKEQQTTEQVIYLTHHCC